MIRTIALVMNIALIGWIIFMMIIEPPKPETETSEWVMMIFLSSLPVINILALCSTKGDSWLGLYLKRKKAEERKRIEELEGSAKNE